MLFDADRQIFIAGGDAPDLLMVFLSGGIEAERRSLVL